MEALQGKIFDLNWKSVPPSYCCHSLGQSWKAGNQAQYLPLSQGTNQSIDVFVFVSVL